MKGWHFTPIDRRLQYSDNRMVVAGETLKVDVPLVLCESGLHASGTVYDALRYAPGPYLWRVELGGDVIRGDDKATASERTALYGFDATDILRRYARLCALDVVHLWDAPDVVVRYLKAGDESIREAARAGAWVAAWAAAGVVAREAAARAAAWAARWAAAREAAREAARVAAWARQKRRLASMVNAEVPRLGVNRG